MRQEYKGKVLPLHTSIVHHEQVHLGGDQRVFFLCEFLSKGKSSTYSSHLHHLDATSPVDGLWWRGQMISLKIRVSCSHNSLLLHSLLELLCFVLSSSPPPYNPSCLFATRHDMSRFSKILQIIVEDAWQRRFLWRLVVKVVKLCNVNMDFGL
jgi:hypothetical protein